MPVASFPTPLVSTEWLAAHLGDSCIKVIDASSYLPNAGRDAHEEYLAGHISGAVFCDLEWISDEGAPYPHTLPSAAVFAQRMGSLGIDTRDAIVVYDASGQNFSAPRLWWMVRTFGHHRVSVLDGGLRKWVNDGHAIDTMVPPTPAATFEAHFESARVRDIHAMRANLEMPREQVVDARSKGRFKGSEPEPRVGVRSGHIPHSVNIHYARLVHEDGTLRSADELRRIVRDAGLDITQPVVASCGTGVTACALILALEVIGAKNTAVYDGSWTEWGSVHDTRAETGAA